MRRSAERVAAASGHPKGRLGFRREAAVNNPVLSRV